MLFEFLTESITKSRAKGFEIGEEIFSIEFINEECTKGLDNNTEEKENKCKTFDEDLLISLVSERPPLFDISLNLRLRSKAIKEKHWWEIKTIMKTDLSLEELSKKWKALRDYYVKIKPEMTRNVPSGSSAEINIKKNGNILML